MLTIKHGRGLQFFTISLFTIIATSASAQYLPTNGGGTVTGNVSVLQGRITTNEIAITDPYGGDDSDPYRLRKMNGGGNNNWLELQLNDDAEESFRIYGHSCANTCGEYSSNLYHAFDAAGNVFHAGNLQVNGNVSHAGNFQVNGTSFFANNIRVQPTTTAWEHGMSFTVPNPSSWGGLTWRRERGDNDGNWWLGYTGLDATDDISFGVQSNGNQIQNVLRLTKSGNVAIGTNTTGVYKLAVDGMVGVRKIVVTQAPNWADYVFHKSYKLMPLPALAAYIKINKHLPEIPSAKTIAKDGLDLAETQRLMMQKIEELTLYVIEQDKQIKQLKTTVRQLKTRRK